MNPENVVFCVLKTQVNWTLVRCLLVRNSKIRIQKKEKRKQHILALQREWIPVFFR